MPYSLKLRSAPLRSSAVRSPRHIAPETTARILLACGVFGSSVSTIACAGDGETLDWAAPDAAVASASGLDTSPGASSENQAPEPSDHPRPMDEPLVTPVTTGTVVTAPVAPTPVPTASGTTQPGVAPEPSVTGSGAGSDVVPVEPAPTTVAPDDGPTTQPTVAPSDVTDSEPPTGDAGVAPAPDADVPDDTDPPPSEFDIELAFLDEQQGMGLSPAVRQAFADAQAVWERVIIGDLSDVDLRAAEPCFAETGAYAEGSIDDLRIFVLVKEIDGPNGVLGAAAPCLARRDNGLPFAGYMEFDSADLERFAADGRLDEVVIHEMGHVLGIGSLWARFDLIVDQSFGNDPNRDTHFTGSRAIAAFDGLGGANYSGAKVPVENVGGEGTANGHWREDLLGNELMTSYMTNLEGVLSSITIGSLEDLGYQVNYAAAGVYEWPPPDERSGGFSFLRGTEAGEDVGDAQEPVHFGNDILDIPVRYVD